MNDLQLGQRVLFTNQLSRVSESRPTGTFGHNEWWKSWEPIGYPSTPTEGVIVGVRTLADGVNERIDYGVAFFPRKHFKAYLVAFDMRQNPVYVLPEHIKREEQ